MGTDIHCIVQAKTNNSWTALETNSFLDRHYLWFAVLANVRNGDGVAGTPYMTSPVPYIQEHRGYPDDFELPDGVEWLGDHSFGYVTLQELLDYDWSISISKLGMVSLDDLASLAKDPTAVVSIGDKRLILNKLPSSYCLHTNSTNYLPFKCTVPIAKLLDHELQEIDRLKNKAKQLGIPASHIRLVFGFDS